MTLQDWGAIGELVGAVAVIVTLIYLAKEIRLNTSAMAEGRRLALAQRRWASAAAAAASSRRSNACPASESYRSVRLGACTHRGSLGVAW
jgi:hypothetical protein